MTSLIFKKEVTLPLPSPDDRRAYDQRIRDALGLGPLSIPLSVMRRLPDFGRQDAAFPCVIGRMGSGHRLIDIGTGRSCSIALDLGTTNLVALLYDNVEKRDVLTRSLENPQIKFGSDILTRMHHVMSGRADEVHDSLIDGINGLIAVLCKEAGIDAREIHAVTAEHR
jgi:uncharacterized 2Fe-2S/4Fe-4S cluster protein (DUF4445 family)